MKLNGLTNNLKDDKSLSNSYLSHIVELLRQEVEALSAKETALEEITNGHIETQKVLVDTKEVKAESVNTNKLQVTSINEKIILSNVIDVLTSLRVNGKDVLTEATFQGPFTYKGIIETLPETAEAGDVYISNDKVNIFNGTDWDNFILPVGTVSLAEYNEDRAKILSDISTIGNNLVATKNDLENFKTDTNTTIETIFTDLSNIDVKLVNKVDEAPKNDNAYVRKNGEWIEQTAADNTVKSVAGKSTIENTDGNGVKIDSPKVEINTPDFKINGSDLPEVDKLALSKTVESGDNYYYEMKFGRSPYKSVSSIQQGWCTYGDFYHECVKSPSEKYSIFTKNWQYCKFNLSGSTGENNQSIEITAMDKDGNINNIQSVWTDWIEPTSTYLQIASFFTFNQEYVPEGWDDTVWLFCTGLNAEYSQNKPYLIELKDGEFSRKIDIYNGVGKLKEQGYTPYLSAPGYSHYLSTGCGKGLRNKNINRICWVSMNVADQGGNYALIIGGDKNSSVNDPFDPSKCIYVPLPATAHYSYDCMAATDSAWYLQENKTGRIMRITPDGQVSEINLTEAVISCGFNYIEYTDKNNRPACAYYVHNNSSGGGHYVVFLEEEEGGQVNFIERKVTSDAFTPTGDQWYAQQFKFMENSHYIFFTADCGFSVNGGTNYGSASMKNMLWYWDKKTHTTHVINNFYEGITRSWDYGFIEMHKTRGNAIWFPYIIQDLAATERTGELHFISDIDYTNIDENGKDIGEIQVQTATVGTSHSFFTCGSNYDNAWQDYYTHPLQGSPSWANAGTRNQLSATNDDGILCVMSADLKAYALCYGDGNIKVYECSKSSSDGRYNCDPDKVPIVPDEPYSGNTWYAGHACLFGMTHGWVLSVYPCSVPTLNGYTGDQSRSYTYIGIQYRNGEPTILVEPHLSKIQRTGAVHFPQRTKFEKYDYLQTYDDYERRKKVLGEIRANLQYAVGSTGTDSYFKEVKKEKKLINLLYNNKVISSIEQ